MVKCDEGGHVFYTAADFTPEEIRRGGGIADAVLGFGLNICKRCGAVVKTPDPFKFVLVVLRAPGEPCGHPGCLSHVSHPCEGCGRIAGGQDDTAEREYCGLEECDSCNLECEPHH